MNSFYFLLLQLIALAKNEQSAPIKRSNIKSINGHNFSLCHANSSFLTQPTHTAHQADHSIAISSHNTPAVRQTSGAAAPMPSQLSRTGTRMIVSDATIAQVLNGSPYAGTINVPVPPMAHQQ